jgi:hypothetical protein
MRQGCVSHSTGAGTHSRAGPLAGDGPRRVRGHDLADHEPVKEHPDSCEVLLGSRSGVRLRLALNVAGDVMRLDGRKLVDPAFLASRKKFTHVVEVRRSSMFTVQRPIERCAHERRDV